MGPLLAALALALTLQAAPAAAGDWLRERPAAKPGHAYPSLYCVNRGARVELGETTCLRTNCCPVTGCETFTARCELSANSPMFRKLRDGCPDGITRAPAPPSSAPAAPG